MVVVAQGLEGEHGGSVRVRERVCSYKARERVGRLGLGSNVVVLTVVFGGCIMPVEVE